MISNSIVIEMSIQDGDKVRESKLKNEGWVKEHRVDDFDKPLIVYIDPDSSLQALPASNGLFQVCHQAFATRGVGS